MPAPLIDSPRSRRLDPRLRPLDVLLRWPARVPLACLISGGGSPRSRWSIFASPSRVVRCDSGDADPMGLLARTLRSCGEANPNPDETVPFTGGWIGWLSYDLGRAIEDAAQAPVGTPNSARAERDWPLFELMRCEGAFVYDHARAAWRTAGDARLLPDVEAFDDEAAPATPRIEPFDSLTGRAAYEAAVARIIDRIRSGDIFQANLAHRLSAAFEGSPRLIAERLIRAAGPWYGAYIESPGEGRALCSMSPELFLEFDDATRRVTTRPIKGTRALRAGAAEELARSDKDAAELAMIVDLMRNDLGRVREYGSVRVEEARALEAHGVTPGRAEASACSPGVVHGVATISGRVRPEFGNADLIRAAFPPGSVTGAPKIRAMRIIDESEPVRRGPYCGCIGFVGDSGASAWNVAIRTASLTFDPGCDVGRARGVIDYSVGAGIVEGSDPAREWAETIDKARTLDRAFPGCLRSLLNRDREVEDAPRRGAGAS